MQTVMITGDNALTACHIAKEVNIIKRNTMIADVWDDGDSHNFAWRTVDEKKTVKNFDPESAELNEELKKYDLSVTGAGLMQLVDKPCFDQLLPRLWVYARVSPSQKELILTKLKAAGYFTLMCGDGTNDVGALKQAHIGIALLDGSVEDLQKIQKRAIAQRKKAILDKQEELRLKWGGAQAMQMPEDRAKRLKDTMDSLMSDLEGDAPLIKFGDASVAAPFTSKLSSVMSGMCVLF
jgi:manganese-transporting P-type ATPase